MLSLLHLEPALDPVVERKVRSFRVIGGLCLLLMLALAWASALGDLPDRIFGSSVLGVTLGAGYFESKVRKLLLDSWRSRTQGRRQEDGGQVTNRRGFASL